MEVKNLEEILKNLDAPLPTISWSIKKILIGLFKIEAAYQNMKTIGLLYTKKI